MAPGVAVKGSRALDARLGGDQDFKNFRWQRGELLPFTGLRLGDAELGEGGGRELGSGSQPISFGRGPGGVSGVSP